MALIEVDSSTSFSSVFVSFMGNLNIKHDLHRPHKSFQPFKYFSAQTLAP